MLIYLKAARPPKESRHHDLYRHILRMDRTPLHYDILSKVEYLSLNLLMIFQKTLGLIEAHGVNSKSTVVLFLALFQGVVQKPQSLSPKV